MDIMYRTYLSRLGMHQNCSLHSMLAPFGLHVMTYFDGKSLFQYLDENYKNIQSNVVTSTCEQFKVIWNQMALFMEICIPTS